ncbi:MAG: DUF4258 domain-containing protein [Candidatus Hydrogenedentes bacterium]|nr:DUF4258 domain-containing protein [Candidatus Hydrogenedentota bacterium]
MADRGITTIETQYVLKLGYHEKKKDSYAERFGAWNYAIRGFTLDGEKELRVVVTLNPEGVLVITAIDLAK